MLLVGTLFFKNVLHHPQPCLSSCSSLCSMVVEISIEMPDILHSDLKSFSCIAIKEVVQKCTVSLENVCFGCKICVLITQLLNFTIPAREEVVIYGITYWNDILTGHPFNVTVALLWPFLISTAISTVTTIYSKGIDFYLLYLKHWIHNCLKAEEQFLKSLLQLVAKWACAFQ